VGYRAVGRRLLNIFILFYSYVILYRRSVSLVLG